MSSIDIREVEDAAIDIIIFATEQTYDEPKITAHKLAVSEFASYDSLIFIESEDGDLVAIRRNDVSNLIKALEKAKEIWKGVK
jgi:hypothetical protein